MLQGWPSVRRAGDCLVTPKKKKGSGVRGQGSEKDQGRRRTSASSAEPSSAIGHPSSVVGRRSSVDKGKRPKLRVTIAGIAMKNPVMTASGTFGYGTEFTRFFDLNALGAIIVKTVTM
ncbi:MAG: hypothetical protein ACREIZ_03510, partial [Candidatus Methylomirabilales bacterium]